MPNIKIDQHALSVSLSLLALLLAGWLALSPGLTGPFMLDDFDNLGTLDIGVTDLNSLDQYLSHGNAGPLDRPISKLSFLINDNAWPSDPLSFKKTNVYIHLLIGIFLFCGFRIVGRFCFSQAQSDWLALFAIGLWLTHPFQVSTVLYVVQRMTQLATLFMVIGFFIHVYLRTRYPNPNIKQLVLLSLNFGISFLLAIFSKESGALLPLYLSVIELTLFSGSRTNSYYIWWRRLFLYLPSLAVIGYILYLPRWIGSYEYRDFTLAERLLTEPVIIWDYLHSIFSFQVYRLGLFQDDYPIFSSIFEPKVFLAISAILVATCLSFWLRKRWPIFAFGVLWFLVGHVIESTTVSLELYFEHRNYLSIAGLFFAVISLIYLGVKRLSGDLARFVPIFAVCFLGVSGVITWGFASEWGNKSRIIPIWAAEHPNSPRAQRTFAQHLAQRGMPNAALDHLDDIYKDFPKDLSIPFISAGIACAFDQPMRFDYVELATKVSQHKWTDGLRPAASQLQKVLHDGLCRAYGEQFADILMKTASFGETRKGGTASLLVIAGNMYLTQGDGDAALAAFLKVDQLYPHADSARRIAGLFLGAGQYKKARETLEVAIERDSASGISDAKMKEYIEIFERIDKNLLNSPTYQ
ncbi:tetratricopeptide repeat protein [Marinobacter sp. M3C]|jgi:tetratricopeptide (TPR) repeat protein|uniref:tetratricopeptide repeat protein n=1 Tax=Marinobacter sp. M3C TaxID=2917715 RepID=UPI00200D88A4|nr:tetratricopeptide repeat protein [Marinobacter sp. M3C]MCL1477306.1 tetratricopeptide repeat protein [Marinobacter sp.]UQG61794.1 tetratricopeptide repeat protein [Marinobacter sp. M3C]